MLKKIVVLATFCLFINCTDTTNLGNCIQTLPLNVNTNLKYPEMINAQTPGGFAQLSGGSKGILIFNKNGSDFVAFDRLCPNNDCAAAMIFENRILQCTCDKSKYSVDFGGAPQTDGFQCPAIEYKVTKRGDAITISNF